MSKDDVVEDLGEGNIHNPANFLDQLDYIRIGLQKSLNKEHQSEFGQFFTPPSTSKMMASMFTDFLPSIDLVDPGAGAGSLSPAFVAHYLKRNG